TQTRRIGALVDQYPQPRVEIHPRLAEQHGIKDGDWVAVTTRRAEIVVQAMVVRTIRPDTVFIPYHWAGKRSVNKLTHRTLDPRSKIPEFKVSACRIRKAERALDWASTETVPFVCMHCEDPTCAKVCPADAIKKTEDGVVQSSLKPRCIACSNCVLACPFGIPKMMTELEQMMKCDMCYDRTSEGKRPMCATVCPSQELAFVPREQI